MGDFSFLRAACGEGFNVTATERNSTFNPQNMGWWGACAPTMTDDDDALKTCLVSNGMCASVLTSDALPVYRKKMNGSYNETVDGDKFFTAQKACVAEKFCQEYADLMM